MSTVIYTERGRRELGERFCWYVEHGESDRAAEYYSGLCRRTFERWCRGCPALAAKYARAVEARAVLYKRRKVELRGRLAAAKRELRRVPAKSELARAARVKVEQRRREVVEFAAMVCRVRLTVGNAKRQKRMAR